MTEQNKDIELAKELQESYKKLKAEIGKVIFGQHKTIEHLIIALFSNGHSLFVGVPGLAKTLLISTLAKTVDLNFNRVQFTPDLMPSDISGFDILQEDAETNKKIFKFMKGPIFTNILLADEINRTPPKTQAALLQAMQEREVTASGITYKLEYPFLVFATQNPIEHEGTYPLPEAQQDRFMFNIPVKYPSLEEEIEIVQKTTIQRDEKINIVLTPKQLLSYQELILKVPVSEDVIRYVVKMINNTRPETTNIPEVKEFVEWGAGPRGSQYLILGAKTKALLEGRYHVSYEDVNSLAYLVLNHRIILNYKGEANGITAEEIINKIITYMGKSNV